MRGLRIASLVTLAVTCAIGASIAAASEPPATQTIDHRVLLNSEASSPLELVVREVVAETIPLSVSYQILSPTTLADEAIFSWKIGDQVSTASAPKFFFPTEGPFEFKLVVSLDDESYIWERPSVRFPLHTGTPILCDVRGFGIDPDTLTSVEWQLRNWEMGAPATLALANLNSAVAVLECSAPTFLDVECSVELADGSRRTFEAEATVYSKDGCGFASTGFGFYFTDPALGLDSVMRELPRALADLHCDHIVVAIEERYGEPEGGQFFIHSIDAMPNGEADPRGYTISSDELAAIVETARAEDFDVWIVLSASPYVNAGEWRNSYQGWAAGNNADYRLRSSFLDGRDGQGLRASFLRRLDFIVANQDVITTVYLGAEWQYELTMGGSRTARFYGEVVDAFREAGYVGAMSHACMTGTWGDEWLFERLVEPNRCAMPFQDKMDLVGSTFYSRLLMTQDELFPGSAVLLDRARDLTDTIYTAIHENYGMPASIIDFYCLPSENCLFYPTIWDLFGPVNLEAFLQYHGTWLTALSEVSSASGEPWLSITVGLYRAIADRYYRSSGGDPLFSTHAWVNAGFPNNEDYRRFLAAFFGDYPFLSYSITEAL